MKTTCACLGLALLAVSFGEGRAAADEPVLLRYKMEKDKPLIYRTEMSLTQAQTVGETKIDVTMKQTDVGTRTLEKVSDDGNLQIRTENKQLKVKLSGIGDYTYDSTATEREKGSVLSGALNPLYERMTGAQLTVTVTSLGQVTQVEGYEQLLGDLLKDNPIAAQFAAGGSKEAGKLSAQEGFDQLSEKPVKPGDRWEIPYEIELPKLGKAKGKRIYTYEGSDKVGDRTTARIGVALELEFDIDVEVNGAKVTGKLSSKEASGTIQFDPERGQIVSKKANYTIAGDMSLAVNGMTIAMTMDQKQSVAMELLDKLPE